MLQDNDIRMCETVHLSPALVATPIYSEMLAVIVRAKDGKRLTGTPNRRPRAPG